MEKLQKYRLKNATQIFMKYLVVYGRPLQRSHPPLAEHKNSKNIDGKLKTYMEKNIDGKTRQIQMEKKCNIDL